MGKTCELSLEKITANLQDFCRNNAIQKAIVFGSYARKTNSRKSDLDIILIKRTDQRFFKRYDTVEDIHHYLKGIAADILIYTPEEFEAISSRPFIKKALKEGKVVYEC